MALYDNKFWLLSHIRNSFISTDDTGMCELVMVGEEKLVREKFFSKEPFQDPDLSEEEDDDDTGSYDLQIDSEYNMRERSLTAARLEKLEYNSRKVAKMKHIKWEPKNKAQANGDADDIAEELFVMKIADDVGSKTDSQEKSRQKSVLTTLIEQSVNMPVNPYMEFAKFDGSGQIHIPTRKYRIYLTMLPEDQRNYPLHVCCIATAKIQDLIGLILLKFSTTNSGDYPLKPVENYGLYITEEDGEVDSDFPSLDNRECVAKFGFTCLGLVEHDEPPRTVDIVPTGESPSSPDSNGAKKRTLSSSKAEETKQIRNDMMLMADHNKAMEAPLFKSYKVHIVNKFLWNIEVHLGISCEKIEIDPIAQKQTKLQIVKQAPVSHSMESIAWCEITETKGNKGVFKLVYSSKFDRGGGEKCSPYTHSMSLSSPLQSSPSFKHYDFEAERSIAEEVVQKVNFILNLRSISDSRREYLERKHLSKRKSFKYLRP